LEEFAMTESTSVEAAPESDKTTRRDFLYVATAAFGTIGAVASTLPFISQMNPDASTLAAGGPVELDLGKVAPGQQVVVRWRSRPVFVTHRTPEAAQKLKDPKLLALLADPQSSEQQQPPYVENWHRSTKPEFGIVVGICTHLGCVPLFEPQPNATTPTSNWPGGYFCPCHGSKYDLAGRVYRGVPAPYNLPVPPHHFVSDTIVRIGENPPNSKFEFSSIKQV
jgi:ubiquinol-cytochrome c reductase iron-sulfur subunit